MSVRSRLKKKHVVVVGYDASRSSVKKNTDKRLVNVLSQKPSQPETEHTPQNPKKQTQSKLPDP